MSRRLVELAAAALGSHTSRRGFLRRMAMAGSAMVAAPSAYILRPISPMQALVLPSNCPGGKCAEGWTEFCCTLTGVNTCPPGTIVAGWWRAEGSGYCSGGSRYYMDCNSSSCGGCGCGSSGTCGNDCVDCACHCTLDRCDLWKTCCTRFRYGQCNQHVSCVGPIVCRVVTCVPPWEWDSTCTKSDARDDFTRAHDAACLRPPLKPYRALAGVVRGSTWLLRSSLSAGPATQTFTLGVTGDVPLAADWTGAGVATPAVVRGARHGAIGDQTLTWYVRQVEGPGRPDLIIEYGLPGDRPVAGSWTGNGVHSIGVVRGNQWLLKTRNAPGNADISFVFGEPGDIPVVGDWDGDGRDGIGMVRGTTWYLRNTATAGPADHVIEFGNADAIPIVGDWNGAGFDRIGRFKDGSWTYINELSASATPVSFSYGIAGDLPAVWRRLGA